MPRDYDSADIWFTDEGDFDVAGDGDVRDTSEDPLRSILQEIRTRLKSRLNDWLTDPQIGAGLHRFVGEPNTRALAEDIEEQIKNSLTIDGLIAVSDIRIITLPLDMTTLLFRVLINAASIAIGRGISADLVYDSLTNGIVVL